MQSINVFAGAKALLAREPRVNFGDNLMRPLLNELYGLMPAYVTPERAELIGAGSILDIFYRRLKTRTDIWRIQLRNALGTLAGTRATLHVWGSGFMESDTLPLWPQRLVCHAVRGPLSRSRICGRSIALGDPALLLPWIWPRLATPTAEVAIVPHNASYRNFLSLYADRLPRHWTVIDLLDPPAAVARAIAGSEFVVSSSLHGLIVADAYGVPSCWMLPHGRLSGDGFKFADYAAFRGSPLVGPLAFEEVLASKAKLASSCQPRQPASNMLDELQRSFPFR